MGELGTRALTDLVELLEKWIEVVPPYLVDLFNRYATFGIFKEWFMTLLCLIVFIGSIFWWYKFYKACDEDIDCIWAICVVLLTPVILSIVGFFTFGWSLLEAIFLPEIYVIHDLQGCTSC
jgi:hypothetical protein